MQFLFPLLMFGAMWLLLIRPQQQRVRNQRALLTSLTVGDEVVTAGGVLGRITDLDGERVTLSVAPAVEVTVIRAAVTGRADPAGGFDIDGDGKADV